jgi:cbb3-type cytochrome oxidase maturation protein
MEIMYLLVPVSVILVFIIGIAFWWSLRSGQYDDLEGPGYRVLMDNDKHDDKREHKHEDKPEDGAGQSK